MKVYLTLFLLSIYTIQLHGQSKADSLEQLLKTTGKNDTTTANLLKELCKEYVDLDNKKLEKHAQSLLIISKKTDYVKGQAWALNYLGVIKDIDSDFMKALEYYRQALTLAKNIDDKRTIASITNNIGLIEWKKGDLKKALTYFFDGIKQAESIKNIKLQANISSNIGLVFQDLNRHRDALEWQKKALKLRLKLKDDYGLASTFTNLASAYSYLKNEQASIWYQKKAIALQQKIGDDYGLGISYLNLGAEYKIIRNYPMALKYYFLSKAIREKNNDKLGMTFIYMSIAIVYKNQQKFKEAIEYGEKSLVIAQEIKSNERIADNSLGLSEIYQAAGDYRKALNLLNEYIKHHDKIFNEDMNKKVSELQIKYQTKEKENQLNKSKLLLAEKDNVARKRNLWLFGIGTVTIVILAGSWYIYRQQRQTHLMKTEILKMESQNKLHEQRLDISRNLHDNIGSQLTFINSFMDTLKLMADAKNDVINKRINDISTFTKEAITELRDTVWALNNDELNFEDLRLRILNFIDKARAAKENIQFRFEMDPQAGKIAFSSAQGINLYRTIQEALNNAIKYSNATEIDISATAQNHSLMIYVVDNGSGFDQAQSTGGYGLYNMQKRVEEMGGQFKLTSSTGQGTQIQITLKEISYA